MRWSMSVRISRGPRNDQYRDRKVANDARKKTVQPAVNETIPMRGSGECVCESRGPRRSGPALK